jgi:serine phosphatase RsbU (regulator of sigma subunit)
VFDDSRFVTVFCAQFDPPTHCLRYANAGHPPAILRRGDGSSQLLEATGPIVCSALASLPSTHAKVVLAPGDTILIYTDGLAEAGGDDGEMFGHGRVRSLVANSRLTGAALLQHLMQALIGFTAHEALDDDVTIMAVDVTA